MQHSDHTIITRDLRHIWHPCMRMQTFETTPPLVVHHAEEVWLHTNQGKILDGIGSWWCKSLGHQHPAIIEAITAQLQRFAHVMTAQTTFDNLASLGETLARITGNQHAFFASDGSCAVEIAMKLACHAMQIRGEPDRHRFVTLQNSYHGETFATLSVSDLGLYKQPYAHFCQKSTVLTQIPYVYGTEDPLWSNAERAWHTIYPVLEEISAQTCAIIVEPIVQGAAGMRIYSADFLKRLAQWAGSHGIYLIADEIMTGLGRTGLWLASQYAGIQPDIICLSKGLTAGHLPFSAAMISDALYQLFYNLPPDTVPFLHSHTYTGHALGVAAALATLHVLESESLIDRANIIGHRMHQHLQDIAKHTHQLHNIRTIGAIAAAELVTETPDAAKKLQRIALEKGLLIRPLGSTLYWFPPLNVSMETLDILAEMTEQSLLQLIAGQTSL